MSSDDKKLYPSLYADGPYPNLDLDQDAATPPLAPAPAAPPLGPEPRPALATVHASRPGLGNHSICGLMEPQYTVHRAEIGKVTCPECKSRLR